MHTITHVFACNLFMISMTPIALSQDNFDLLSFVLRIFWLFRNTTKLSIMTKQNTFNTYKSTPLKRLNTQLIIIFLLYFQRMPLNVGDALPTPQHQHFVTIPLILQLLTKLYEKFAFTDLFRNFMIYRKEDGLT